MSMKPTGDQGQRYEVLCVGYPDSSSLERFVIGWTEHLENAERMAKSIALAPGVRSWTIRDRWHATSAWPNHEYTQMVQR